MDKNSFIVGKNKLIQAPQSKILLGVMVFIILFSASVLAFNFNDGNLRLYYDFQANTELVSGVYNLTNSSTTVNFTADNCLIGICGHIKPNNYFTIPSTSNTNISGNSKSLNFWVRVTNPSPSALFFSRGSNNPWVSYSGATTLYFGPEWVGGVKTIGSTTSWVMITYVANETGGNLFVNGTLLGAGTATFSDTNLTVSLGYNVVGSNEYTAGQYDEMGWWNRSLTQSEITELYNDGSGLTYGAGETPSALTVALTYPPNSFSTTLTNISLNATLTPVGLNLTNATYFLWNTNGSLFNQSQVTVTGNVANHTISNITNLFQAGYKWNVYACGINSTGTLCNWATSNSTFSISLFTIVNESYSESSIEGSEETFEINISLISGESISTAYLNYNNTRYLGTFSLISGNDYNIKRTINADNVAATSNLTFFWDILLNSGYASNTSQHNQTVYSMLIDDCSSNTILILNYTMRDELTQARFNNSVANSSVEITTYLTPSGSSVSILNYSQNYTNIGAMSIQVCLSTNLTESPYRLYSTVKYSATDYVTRYNYIQNSSLTNLTIPQNINLYNLATSLATKFFMTYKDTSFIAVPNAIISMNRKYISEGVTKTVETSLTDNYGQATGYSDLNGASYTITVSKNNQVLSTFENIVPFCENTLTGECKINLDASAIYAGTIDFYNYNNFLFNSAFNQATRTYTVNFQTGDGSVALVSVNLTKFDAYTNLTLCSNQVSTSSGSLSCAVPSGYNNVTFFAEIWKDNSLISREIYSITPKATEAFKGNIIIFLVGLLLFFGMIFIPSPVGIIFGTLIGFATSVILFFVSGGKFLGGSLMMIIIIGGVIIWRLRQGGSD